MDCKEAKEQLELLALGGLEPAEVSVVQRHLDGCAECRAEAKTLQALGVEIGAVGRRAPASQTPDFARVWTRVVHGIRAERKKRRFRMGALAVAKAAAILMAAGAGLWFYVRDQFDNSHAHAVINWRFQGVAGAPAACSPYPLLRGNWVYAVQGEKGAARVVAIDKLNGKPIWKMAVQVVSALAADDRRVFVLGSDARGRRGVWALDKVSGRVMWHKDRELPAAETDGPSSLAVAGDGVCVVSGSMISFFDRRTGDSAWSFHMGTSGMTSVCGTSGGQVYVAGGQVLCALQSVSGQVVWRQNLEGVAPLLSRPMIWADESHVAVVRGGALKGGVVSVRHPRDGRLLWEQAIGTPMSAQVAGGRIYVKSTKLEVLDLQSGQRLWSAPMDGCSPVAWSGEHVYVVGGKQKQNIVSLNAATGQQQWEQRLAGSCSGVVVAGDRGYLRGHNGVLYAITIRDRT